MEFRKVKRTCVQQQKETKKVNNKMSIHYFLDKNNYKIDKFQKFYAIKRHWS